MEFVEFVEFAGSLDLAGGVQPDEGVVGEGADPVGFVVEGEAVQDDTGVEACRFAPGGHAGRLEVGERAARGAFRVVPTVHGRMVVADVPAGHRQVETDQFSWPSRDAGAAYPFAASVNGQGFPRTTDLTHLLAEGVEDRQCGETAWRAGLMVEVVRGFSESGDGLFGPSEPVQGAGRTTHSASAPSTGSGASPLLPPSFTAPSVSATVISARPYSRR
ncbi:hypothetical protein [Streptomyces sp. NPDC055005]